MRMPKASAIHPPHGSRPRGKIEVLPSAIHSIAVEATLGCYGVLGIAAPYLRNGQAILLAPEHSNQGIRLHILNNEISLDVYVALEYGLRISEIAHTIMNTVKFSIEQMLGISVTQVNVNVQGLIHGPGSPEKE